MRIETVDVDPRDAKSREFTPYAISLGAIDYSSLAARNVMKTLLVRSMTAAPGEVDRVEDADGDEIGRAHV